MYDRVAIRPVFPRHVLFFRVKNSVRPDFFNFMKCPGFLIDDPLSLFHKFSALVMFLIFQFFTCDNTES